MKIKEGYLLRVIADQIVVVPVGVQAVHFNGIISLNKTGKVLWELLQNETTLEALIQELINRYDVDYDNAASDVLEFVEKLRSNNLLA